MTCVQAWKPLFEKDIDPVEVNDMFTSWIAIHSSISAGPSEGAVSILLGKLYPSREARNTLRFFLHLIGETSLGALSSNGLSISRTDGVFIVDVVRIGEAWHALGVLPLWYTIRA